MDQFIVDCLSNKMSLRQISANHNIPIDRIFDEYQARRKAYDYQEILNCMQEVYYNVRQNFIWCSLRSIYINYCIGVELVMIYKFNVVDNKILGSYYSIQEAADANGLSYRAVHRQVRGEKNFKRNRKPYYFSEKPLQHKVIAVYDNMYLEEVGRYWSIQNASDSTGVDRCTIINQLDQDKPFSERYQGSTGLWFKYIEV